MSRATSFSAAGGLVLFLTFSGTGAADVAGLAAKVATPIEDDGVPGVPVPLPKITTCTETGMAAPAECITAGNPSAHCTNIASGPGYCEDYWGDTAGYRKLADVIVYYGPSTFPQDERTTGSDKAYVRHDHAPDDIHSAVTWWIDFNDGDEIAGCQEYLDHPGYSNHRGAHGQMVSGRLTKDESEQGPSQLPCFTGDPKGWYGGGVNFR